MVLLRTHKVPSTGSHKQDSPLHVCHTSVSLLLRLGHIHTGLPHCVYAALKGFPHCVYFPLMGPLPPLRVRSEGGVLGSLAAGGPGGLCPSGVTAPGGPPAGVLHSAPCGVSSFDVDGGADVVCVTDAQQLVYLRRSRGM